MKLIRWVVLGGLLLNGSFLWAQQKTEEAVKENEPKLYWFIPDGMRADPDVFQLFEWAKAGELPNIKKMMENGSYGYAIPNFPSHTPTNFATLLTGTYPEKNGVADGPMHTQGNPLSRVSVGGFNSAAKKVDPIWVTLERQHDKNVVLLSIPGSTPPELDKGISIRGRWSGWGADFHATNFSEKMGNELQVKQGRGARLFFFGPHLSKFDAAKEVSLWPKAVVSHSPVKRAQLTQYGTSVYADIYDSTDNQKTDYDRIAFSFDKETVVSDLKEGEWSEWIPITLNWTVQDQPVPVDTSFKIKVIKLDEDGFYRVRFFYNNLNKHLVKPSHIAQEIIDAVGPMVDFVDNFPAQLIYYDEDKATFLEEANMSLDWHRAAARFVIDQYNPEIFINDIYTPNQMLTSRWWMGYIDPKSTRYNDVSEEERKKLWSEVKAMYKKLDAIIGEMMKKADDRTYIILSSDHGAIPLDRYVRLNNYFAQKGWLKFTIDPQTGEPIIDWKNSKVIYLKMAHVYIHPGGLDGNWSRASGPEYEKLREEVKNALLELKDPQTGIKPVVAVHKWEEVPKALNLPVDRVGDLVIANKAGYGWYEEMTQDSTQIFEVPLISGYKQAVLAQEEKGMWTPFVVMGPGVKKGYQIKEPISLVHQVPTVMRLLGKTVKTPLDGKILDEILE
jgi:predicted AlkP superfamily phosphohydrolase/phosphomutase